MLKITHKGYDWKNNMKVTAVAPSNIAFIKYWGKKDEYLRLPENGSISMNLSNLQTTTTVEFSSDIKKDTVVIDGMSNQKEQDRVIAHLDRIRAMAKIKERARVISRNNFPTSTGLSSSASGFAALSLAGSRAAGLKLSEKELSILARMGSGSACRSIPDGFTEWLAGETSDDSYAVSLFPPDYWNILDIVAVVSKSKKVISTSEGQKLSSTSPFFSNRLLRIKDKIADMKKLIREKDFEKFGEIVEAEALELHAIMLTSTPPLIYWLPQTVEVMRAVVQWRKEGLPVYFTVNTGQDVHLLIEEENKKLLLDKLKEVKGVKNIIINRPAVGSKLSTFT